MAKRRKKAKVSGRRRSRSRKGLGGIKVDAMQILSVVAGAVGAGMLNKIIPPTVNDKITAGGKVLVGILLPNLAPAKYKNIAAGIGAGFIAVGAVDGLKSFGVLSGDFDIPVLNGDELGADDLDVLSAAEEELGEEELGADDDDD